MKPLMMLFAAAIALAPVAHAPVAHAEPASEPTDQQTAAYLAEIEANGARPKRFMTEKLVKLGQNTCFNIRHGMSPGDIIKSVFAYYDPGVAVTVVSAAQHQLCPDTL